MIYNIYFLIIKQFFNLIKGTEHIKRGSFRIIIFSNYV